MKNKYIGRKFKMGEVKFEDLLPGDIVEGITSDGKSVVFEALEEDIEMEQSPRSGVSEFGVNLSGKNVPVYTTATGNTLAATLYPNECFVFTGSKSGSRNQVEVLNPSGKWVKGWYVGTNGISFWKNRAYYYGSIKVDGRPSFKARVYKITKSTGVYHGDKTAMGKGKLYDGDYIYVEADQCYPGSTERDWIKIRGFTYQSSASKEGVYSSCDEYGSYYGFVDTQIKHTPKAPAVRGSW